MATLMMARSAHVTTTPLAPLPLLDIMWSFAWCNHTISVRLPYPPL